MALTPFDKDIEYIQKLDDEPNDVQGLTSAELKKRFDQAGMDIKAYLNDTLLPGLEALGVGQAVLLPENSAGFKYLRLNSDKALEVSTDGETWQATVSSGHIIIGPGGTELPQRSRMQFTSGTVEDNNGVTVITGPQTNLIHNWYFADPIDQRGGYVVPNGTAMYTDASCTTLSGNIVSGGPYQGYAISDVCVRFSDGSDFYVKKADCVRGYTGAGMTIDRWRIHVSGTLLLTDNGLSLDSIVNLGEVLEGKRVPNNVPVTASLLTDSGLASTTFNLTGEAQQTVSVTSGGITLSFIGNWHGSGNHLFEFDGTGILKAVKLELGDHQTLAHQDADGNWVLNDPPPDKALELARCQRYYIPGSLQWCTALYVEGSGLIVSVPAVMRTSPVLSDGANRVFANGVWNDVSGGIAVLFPTKVEIHYGFYEWAVAGNSYLAERIPAMSADL